MIPEPRYAIYLAPEPHEPLWQFGSAWLGYDAETGRDAKHPALPGLSADVIREATAHPRLYGLHITLKAPFRLREGATPLDLEQSLQDLAGRHDPIGPFALIMEARKVEQGRVFLCLAPEAMQPALHRLEADAVVSLDPFRAPLSPGEVARRRPDRLGARERDYLERYGYPHILDCFRPHLSLTGPIEPDSPVQGSLAQCLDAAPALRHMTCLSVLLCEQPEPGARFHIRMRCRLGASGQPI